MRRRPELGVVGAALLLAVLVLALPASAQSTADPVTTTTAPATTSTTTGITLLPPTTALGTTTTARPTSTSARVTTSTTVATGPAITLPAKTTTTELLEPPGPVGLPTTTSLAPQKRKADGGISVGTIVWLLIAGLLLLALVLALFTWRFVHATRPTAAPAPAPQGAGTVPDHG